MTAAERRAFDAAQREAAASAVPKTATSGAGANPPAKPPILSGWPEDWPDDLDPISDERWAHIIADHGPGAQRGKSLFKEDTDIGNAIRRTCARLSIPAIQLAGRSA
ncbi:MAG: hypothetical protein LBR20_01105 [Propionibacteriaceae bacterium]|jgi:hypothetical protein|nr:hypothetical protein [Propionibacteriaceae bacterium]